MLEPIALLASLSKAWGFRGASIFDTDDRLGYALVLRFDNLSNYNAFRDAEPAILRSVRENALHVHHVKTFAAR